MMNEDGGGSSSQYYVISNGTSMSNDQWISYSRPGGSAAAEQMHFGMVAERNYRIAEARAAVQGLEIRNGFIWNPWAANYNDNTNRYNGSWMSLSDPEAIVFMKNKGILDGDVEFMQGGYPLALKDASLNDIMAAF